jgi:hypothetical protein
MQTFDFIHKLRKCNKDLWVDTNHAVYLSGRTDYPVQGLYYNTKHLMAIPYDYVPEHSIAAVDFNELLLARKKDRVKEIIDTGFAEYEEKLIWRGWRAIVGGLIRMNLITQRKAEKVFNTYFEPNRTELPRQFINRPI